MAHLTLIFLGTAILATIHLAAAATSFGGVNHYFLAALPPTERQSIIETLHAAKVRVIRTFVRPEDAFDIEKGNAKAKFPDLESPLGTFDTKILDRYDDMLYDVHRISRGQMKVLLSLHDANMIAGHTQPCDAYCQYMKKQGMDWGKFYTDASLRLAFKTRLRTILVTYKSKKFPGKSWSQLREVLFGIDLQNEPGVGNRSDLVIGTGWICDISTHLRSLLAPEIAVATGGIGGGLDRSNNFPDEVFSCPAVDIISLHGYFSRSSGATSAGQPWCNLLSSSDPGTLLGRAKAARKLVMAEEWAYNKGSTGIKKEDITAQGHALNALGIPWTYWDVMTGNEECQGWCQDKEVSVTPGGSPSGAWDALKNVLGEAGRVPLADGQDWSRFLETASGGVSITDGTCGRGPGGGGGGGGGCTWGCLGWDCSAQNLCQGDLECNGNRKCSSCTWGCAGWTCSSSSPCKDQLQCISGTCQKCAWGCLGWSCNANSPCSGEFECISGVCKPCTWGCRG
ncbi:Glycoside hydrolase superfamily [Rhypophila decipiens]